MTYKLEDQSGTVTENLTSFWFFMPFELLTNGEVMLTKGATDSCHVAVLLDGTAIVRRPPDVVASGNAASYSLTVKHKYDGDITFGHLNLVQSVRVYRNNEWAELRLYRGDGEVEQNRPTWIDASGWTRGPYGQKAGPSRWNRTFSFGGINGSAVDEAVVVSNEQGTPTSVVLIRRLVKGGSLCNTVIGKGSVGGINSDIMPELTISTGTGSDLVAEMNKEKILTEHTKSDRRGFVMMTAGAFSWQSADNMLAHWRSEGSSKEICNRLERIAWSPENVAQFGKENRRFLRKLHNTHDTGRDGAFSGTGLNTDPVEVLYVESGDDAGDIK